MRITMPCSPTSWNSWKRPGAAARSVNAVLTATYWELGRRIVEREQGAVGRARYGEGLRRKLADDLTGDRAKYRRT